MAIPLAPMALPAADDDNGGQFTMDHVVDSQVRGKALSMVYTSDPVSVDSSIQTMEQFLAEDKFLGKRDPTFFVFCTHVDWLEEGLSRYFLITFFEHMLIGLNEGLSRYFTTCFQNMDLEVNSTNRTEHFIHSTQLNVFQKSDMISVKLISHVCQINLCVIVLELTSRPFCRVSHTSC